MTIPWFEKRLFHIKTWGTYYYPDDPDVAMAPLPGGFSVDRIEVDETTFWLAGTHHERIKEPIYDAGWDNPAPCKRIEKGTDVFKGLKWWIKTILTSLFRQKKDDRWYNEEEDDDW